ncbi:MAG: DUF3014 domain-containing protein [Pseudomonadales bacterium]
MSDNKPLVIALVVVGLLILVYVTSLFLSDDEPAQSTSQAIEIPEPKQAPVPEPEPEPAVEESITETAEVSAAEPEPGFILPRLDDSDQLVRDGVVSLTRHEGINQWLGPDELIRKVVVFVDNIANGTIARQPVSFLAPTEPFSATQVSDTEYVMDEASYRRYNRVTDIFISIDSRRTAEFYDLLRPLFQKAYGELGYPASNFDDVIFRAIGRMLETPVITEPIRLVQPVVTYEYANPRLESLSAAQKQMLRMGPRNTQAIQSKLSELALELRAVLKD